MYVIPMHASLNFMPGACGAHVFSLSGVCRRSALLYKDWTQLHSLWHDDSVPFLILASPLFLPNSPCRCCRPDHSSVTLTLHYLTDGTANVRFIMGRQEFFIPLVVLLKVRRSEHLQSFLFHSPSPSFFFFQALVETTDREIYEKTVQGETENSFLTDNVELLLRETRKLNVHTRKQCLVYIGA